MEIKQGKAEVWQHAKECGIDQDIALIAKYFEIKEVNIFTPDNGGKLTFIDQRMVKRHRVAVATKSTATTKDMIAISKARSRLK